MENIKYNKPETFTKLIQKGNLKQQIYKNTVAAFELIKEQASKFDGCWKDNFASENQLINVNFENQILHEFKLKFAGDMLVFMMHSNIFEFPRAHEINKLPYVKENPDRSYCGTIHVYNFLSDSFKYNRINDSGFLIGRIFINIDNHFIIEGKREIGMIANNFSKNDFNEEAAINILDAAINYSIDFDLLTPSYENVKEISVLDILQTEFQSTTIKTSKRMGFRFQADQDIIK
jgi:hypothetical protein